MVANRREYIHDFTILGPSMAHSIGCEDWQSQCLGNPNGCLVAVFLGTVAMTLQFDVNIARAEQVD